MNLFQLVSFGLFADTQTANSIKQGRSSLSIDEAVGIADEFSIPWLPQLLHLISPNYTPPSWMPVLPNMAGGVDDDTWIESPDNAPLDPVNDYFYHLDPQKYASLANGAVVGARAVGLSNSLENLDRAYQIQYKTRNTFGDPAIDVTTVLIPSNPNGKVISYQAAEDSVALVCSPSYTLFSSKSEPLLNLYLRLGFVVNYPDHQGVKSSFTCGRRQGYSTLDSLRAYLSSRENMGLTSTNSFSDIVLWGFSGGSSPTGQACEQIGAYAPDLLPNVKGGIIGGIINNLTDIITTINGGIFAGFSVAGIQGLATEYPDVRAAVDQSLRPKLRKRFNSVFSTCSTTTVLNFMFQNVWGYTADDTGSRLLGDPRVQWALNNELLGQYSAPPFPMLVYQGVQDEITEVHGVDRVVDYWVKHGTPVDYLRLGNLDHFATSYLSVNDAMEYVYKFMSGYVPAPCDDWPSATKQTEYSGDISTAYTRISNGQWREMGIFDRLKSKGYL